MLVLAVLGAHARVDRFAGTLFSGIEMVIPGLEGLQILPADYPGFLLAILPPGAFILLGCLIAGKNWLDARKARRANAPSAPPAPEPAQA